MSSSTIQCLPVEVLLKVFQAFLGPKTGQRGGVDDLQRRLRPVLLTHVGRDWRRKALGDPFLWTDVQIHGESELFLSFFERSYPLPLDVTIRTSACQDSAPTVTAVSNKLVSMDEETADRIQSIWIFNEGYGDIAILSSLNGRPLPNLNSLYLRRRQIWMGPDTLHANHIAFLTHAKSISSVTLANFCISCIPNQAALTKLELLTLPGNFQAALIGGIIESSPALETLILGDIEVIVVETQLAQAGASMVNAPSLKTLVVTPLAVYSAVPWGADVDQICNPDCHCTLRNLVADKLEYLEISGRKGGSGITHLLPLINRRMKNTEPPSLRLMLNGVEKLEQVHQLPRSLFLHIAPLSFGAPEAYTFTQQFLGAVLYFQGHHGVVMNTFEATGKYHRSRGNNLALNVSNPKEGAIEPLLDPLRTECLITDQERYESYWRQAAPGTWDSFGRTFAHPLGGAWQLNDPDLDGPEVHLHPYGWGEDDEDEEEEYEASFQDLWEDWEGSLEEEDTEEYGGDPTLFGESSATNDDEGHLGDFEQTEVDQGEEAGWEDYGSADLIYDAEDAFDLEDHLQTGVIYHDEIEVVLDTGVLALDEGLYHEYELELSDNPWADEAALSEEVHEEEDLVYAHIEEVVEEAIDGDEQVVEAYYYLEEDGERGALEYEGIEENHVPIFDDGSDAGGGGYASPDKSDLQSEGFYDSPVYSDIDQDGGYSDGGDPDYDSDWF